MSSIREVARVAGVSVATVSRALSNPEKLSPETLRKVHQAIDQTHYRPNMLARNFRSTRSYSLLVMVPDLSNPFFSSVIRAIEDRAQHKGYAVLLGDTRDSGERERDYMRLAETRLADGVIQLRPHSPGDTPTTQKLGFPFINLCGAASTPGPTIRVDNVAAAKEMVLYLVGLGHQRIAVVTGLKDNAHTLDRMDGYQQALKEAGLPYDETLVVEGDFSMKSGRDAANHICTLKKRPTAIFCMNDEMAIGASLALQSRGLRIPDDVSVSGFDDIEYAQYNYPALTTIAQPAEEMGWIATDLLLQQIGGESLEQTEYVLDHRFVERASTGQAPKEGPSVVRKSRTSGKPG